jgi:hypothetical protein
MIWTRVYEDTKELWQEGNIVRIGGKVRVRQERMQIACDAVEPYKLDAALRNPVVNSSFAPLKAVGSNSKNGNAKLLNGNGSGLKTIAKTAEIHRLTIIVRATDDEEKDDAFLERIMEILKESRGKDEVNLRILSDGQITNLKMNIFVDYSPDLHKRLTSLIGPECLIVESLANSPAI